MEPWPHGPEAKWATHVRASIVERIHLVAPANDADLAVADHDETDGLVREPIERSDVDQAARSSSQPKKSIAFSRKTFGSHEAGRVRAMCRFSSVSQCG